MIRLINRDYTILQEIARWRVITSKQVKEIAQFNSQRSCDRRLKQLVEAEYLQRKKILFGIPYLYFLSQQGKALINASNHNHKIKIEQIKHDLIVLDTAIYFHKKYNIAFENMTTEKQLHSMDGFSNRKHKPDFVFESKNKSICVEVELSMKSKDRFLKNIKDNFLHYDTQIWIVEDQRNKIASILKQQQSSYTNIEIIELKEVYNV